MKLIATVGDTHTCPMFTGTTPHVGGTIITGSAKMLANNKPVARMGDKCICTGCGMIATIVQGDANVLVDGKPIAYVGCMTSHGGVITSGQANAFLSGSKPPKLVTMPIDEIDFPEITFMDRVIAYLTGNAENLKKAEENIQELKSAATQEQEKQDKQEEKELPKLQGEIIFVNGYLSDPITNSESHRNAIKGYNPDKAHENDDIQQGENASEKNRISQDDIYTQEEFERDDKLSRLERVLIERAYNTFTSSIFENNIFETPYGKYYGYWNKKANDHKATKEYAKYFNAEDRVHYINGSHGLGSNGAHRVDHGIALGYQWAMSNWKIMEKTKVDEKKGEKPQIESKSPHYKPVTIVGHSQGACMAAGVKLGIIKYAKDKGWDKVAINSIFLGVHQPRGLFGKNYNTLIKKKTKEYLVDQNVFYFGHEEDAGIKFLSKISALYDPKYKKLYNERGLFEHVQAICSDWNAYKGRAVQFTFPNDRGDLVTIDGDIPEIKSACHPKKDKTLFSAEYFFKQESIPAYYQKSQNKEIFSLNKYGATGGFIVIPPYVANRRFDFDSVDMEKDCSKISDAKLREKCEKEKKLGKEWGDYKKVSIVWGVAMHKFMEERKAYEKDFKVKFEHEFDIIIEQKDLHEWATKMKEKLDQAGSKILDWEEGFIKWMQLPKKYTTRSLLNKNKIIRYNRVVYYYRTMLLKYGALQTADLYAHFCPVSHINHPFLLSDFPDDEYTKSSIFERIKEAGKDRFYRMKYKTDNQDEEELGDEQKREQEKKYVTDGNKGKKHLIDTSIVDTEYINNVIKAYVFKQKKYESKLYDEEDHKH